VQESQARQQAVSEQVRIFRNQLPILLKRLSRIKDPRNAKKTKYQLTLLMIIKIQSPGNARPPLPLSLHKGERQNDTNQKIANTKCFEFILTTISVLTLII